MEKYNLPKGWKYEVFDKIENQIDRFFEKGGSLEYLQK